MAVPVESQLPTLLYLVVCSVIVTSALRNRQPKQRSLQRALGMITALFIAKYVRPFYYVQLCKIIDKIFLLAIGVRDPRRSRELLQGSVSPKAQLVYGNPAGL